MLSVKDEMQMLESQRGYSLNLARISQRDLLTFLINASQLHQDMVTVEVMIWGRSLSHVSHFESNEFGKNYLLKFALQA